MRAMKIAVVGGGPGGLYFSLLMKLADPSHDITVYERNRAGDTFGFGVVFSDETLSGFMREDDATYGEILENFAYWDEIEIRYRGSRIRSGGHGFCGMERAALLGIFERRCEALGVKLEFGTEITDFESLRDADLVLAADGVNSAIRETYKEHFKPHIDIRKTKFVWLGTTQTFDAFTFIFKESEHGWFYNHAYQYGRGAGGEPASTWILETHEETWKRAGLDQADEGQTLAFFEDMFKDELGGHPLLANQSLWRSFPVVTAENWHYGNIVLMGDALHPAQFSIGSGTKIAMEDAIALARACGRADTVAEAMVIYEDQRRDAVERLQRTAFTSLSWYENALRYNVFSPPQYAFSFLSRTKSITYDNLRLRDPDYGASIDRWFADSVAEQGFDMPAENPPPPMFTPFRLRGMVVQNRVVVSPMCQYSAEDGCPGDWQLVHLGGLAVGGAGLVYTEMTNVSPEGRISPACCGIYNSEHVTAWKRITDFVHANSQARICVQLGHAGRKGSSKRAWEDGGAPLDEGAWRTLAASALPFNPGDPTPREMGRADMDKVRDDYAAAAERAIESGFDMIEIHMAHGYLLSSFISPLSNIRGDEYGGSNENRMRFPLEVLDAVRAVWPEDKPISVRISATDWVDDGGLTGDDAVEIAIMLKDHGCDIVDVSAGNTSPDAEPIYGRMFQTFLSDQVRQEAGIPTIAVGNITTADQVNTIVAAGRADLVAIARTHLTDPHFTLRAAAQYGYEQQVWPNQYLTGKAQAERMAEQENERQRELLAAIKPPSPRREIKKAAE